MQSVACLLFESIEQGQSVPWQVLIDATVSVGHCLDIVEKSPIHHGLLTNQSPCSYPSTHIKQMNTQDFLLCLFANYWKTARLVVVDCCVTTTTIVLVYDLLQPNSCNGCGKMILSCHQKCPTCNGTFSGHKKDSWCSKISQCYYILSLIHI